MDDQYLESLLQQLVELTENQSENQNNQQISQNNIIQTPIKGTFYNSGGFSFSATDSRHPTGHMGLDMRAPAGTSIYPLTSGQVSFVGTDPKGGNVITIKHPNNLKTYYAHLGTITVHQGDYVNNETVIGTVGNSGNAKGTFPHLHFQVWENGKIENPEKYFSAPKFTNVDKTKENFWLSDQAKEDAQSFNIKKHLSRFSFKINQITKYADLYFKICHNM
jgi:murein DD-endopeptidase MepM/ murein hydrolase activator NlpD